LSAQQQQQLSDMQALLNDEIQKVKNLQMELAAMENENEILRQKVALNGADSSSIHSGNEAELDDTLLGLNGLLLWLLIANCVLSSTTGSASD